MKSGANDGLSLGSGGSEFAIKVRRVSELLFDFLLMGYIDALEAFYHRSAARSRVPNAHGARAQRKSTPHRETSLEAAKMALKLARESHEMISGFKSKQKRCLDDVENPRDETQVISEANVLAEEALKYLTRRFAASPLCLRLTFTR